MQNHQENLAARDRGAIQPLAGVSIAVTDANGNPAALYSDDGVTPQANPMTTDANGYYGFYAANGRYKLTFSGSRIATFTRSVELYDADDSPPATLTALAVPSGASLVGVTGGGTVQQRIDELTAAVSGGGTEVVTSVNGVGPTAGNVTLTTDDIAEDGEPVNLWHTAARVRGTVLAGLSTAVSSAVTAADTLLVAIGKILGAKDASDGYAGLTQFKINFKNVANTFTSFFTNANTAVRTYMFPDKDGTVAMTSDAVKALLGTATVGAAVANIDFLNVFSAAYDKYEIEIQGLKGSAADFLSMRLAKVGAVDAGASVYLTPASSGSTPASGAAANLIPAVPQVGAPITLTVEVRNANDAVNQKGIGVRGLFTNGTPSPITVLAEGSYTGANVVTGFRLYFSTGNITAGTVRVYGIKNS